MRQSIDNGLSAEPVEQSVSTCQRRLDNLIEWLVLRALRRYSVVS
jgi:hypothetical protein